MLIILIIECPSGCDKLEVSPVCGSDGKMYPNSCYLQAASCRRREAEDQLRPAQDSLCARCVVSSSDVIRDE